MSLIESWAALPPAEATAILAELTDEQVVALRYDWPSWARPSQLPPPGTWRTWLLLSGRGFGKTRVGAEWVREQVRTFEHVNLIGPTAADVRDVMVEGESGILACCHPDERPEYLPSRRALHWRSGARTLCFSAEDPEQLRGPQHQRLWCDEIAAWSNHTREETWDLAMFGLRLGPDPRVLATTTPKPVALLRKLVESPSVHITKGSTYENRPNLSEEFFEQVIRPYEGTRLGRQEIDAELLLDEGLAYPFDRSMHVVPPFTVPEWWTRFEGLDHGKNNPTAWLSFAADDDGNVVAHAGYYSPGDVSDHAAAIKQAWQTSRGRTGAGSLRPAVCYADPTIKNRMGTRDWKGREVSVELEYADHGLTFAAGQNDRRAGYTRISQWMKPDPNRYFPDWHPRRREKGAPRLYVQDIETLQPLIEQLRDAPVEDPDSPMSRFPGEAVDAEWEGRMGHAHAAARYALMSRPAPGIEPEELPEDPRARALLEYERRRESSGVERYETL